MAERPLKVTDSMTSEQIFELLQNGERLHVECQAVQFSNFKDRYPHTPADLDELRRDPTLRIRNYYGKG